MIFVAIIVFSKFAMPEYIKMLDNRDLNKTTVDTLIKLSETKTKFAESEAFVNSITAQDKKYLDAILPEEFSSTMFLYYVSSLGSKNGLTIKSFNVSPFANAVSGLKEYDISFTLSGSYDQNFKNFLSEIERNVAWVQSKSISALYGGIENSINYQLSFKAYAVK